MNADYVPKSGFDRIVALNMSPQARARAFAAASRINTLYMIMQAGSGHIGSSFSSTEILTWLFLQEMDKPNQGGDIFFSSKGHDAPAIYSAMIALGLIDFEMLHKLRRLGGLPGHPDVVVTPHVAANTGSLGMGISKAKGMAQAYRLKGEPRHIYVLTGDGELQEGQFWESLTSAANHGLHELTVIVDHNKIQSDTWVSEVSDLGDIVSKLTAFGWHVQRCNGHDFTALENCLGAARAEKSRPSIIIADTVKGYGVSFMQWKPGADSGLYAFHSGAPAPDVYARALAELRDELQAALGDTAGIELETAPLPVRKPPERPQSMIAAYSKALVDQADRNPAVVALDADLVKDTGLLPFRDKYPNRFFECGIAEQDMVSQASGMALAGLIPVVHSFACFLSPRPNEQIFNAATEARKIVYAGSLAGLVPAGPGHSHQSVRDLALLGCIPNLVVIEPSCEAEVAMALDWALNTASASTSTYIRLVSIPCEIDYQLPTTYRMEQGKGVTLRQGSDVAIVAAGPILLPQAMQAANALEASGISVRIINMPWQNHVDAAWLSEAVAGISTIVTLDNHLLAGGLGEQIAVTAAETGIMHGRKLIRLGIDGVPVCGTNAEALAFHKLDAANIAGAIIAAKTK
jgi:transketolase